MAWLISLLISVAISIVSYILAPKPKKSKPPAAQEMDGPTAEAGKEIPVIFGTVTVTSPNCLWYGDKSTSQYEIPA